MFKRLFIILFFFALCPPASAQLIRKEQIEDVFARKGESQSITGDWAFQGLFQYDDLTPAQITSNQNNYVISSKVVQRLSSDATRSITGIAGGTDSRFVILANIGSNDITLKHLDAGSSAGNQIASVTGADLILGPAKIGFLLYDATSTKWRAAVLGAAGGGVGTPGGSNTYVQFNDSSAFGGESGLTYNKLTDVLTAGGGLVTGDGSTNSAEIQAVGITGHVVLQASMLRTKSITFRIGSDTGTELVDTQDEATVWRNNIAAMHVTEVWCSSDAGTPTINLQKDDGSAVDMLISALSCSTSGATSTSFVSGEDALALGNKINFRMVTAGGVAKRVTVSITATVD